MEQPKWVQTAQIGSQLKSMELQRQEDNNTRVKVKIEPITTSNNKTSIAVLTTTSAVGIYPEETELSVGIVAKGELSKVLLVQNPSAETYSNKAFVQQWQQKCSPINQHSNSTKNWQRWNFLHSRNYKLKEQTPLLYIQNDFENLTLDALVDTGYFVNALPMGIYNQWEKNSVSIHPSSTTGIFTATGGIERCLLSGEIPFKVGLAEIKFHILLI